MASDDLKKTSTEKMRTLQLNDKVSVLNRQFIKQLQKWAEECPHYDFTETVQSYLKYLGDLKRMYHRKPDGGTPEKQPAKGKNEGESTPVVKNGPPAGRVIAKAKRRNADDSGAKPAVKISTPHAGEAPSFNCGDVSSISMDKTFSATPKPAQSQPDSTSSTAAAPSAGGGGRKRAIRGGGPLGGAESVVFRGTEKEGGDAPAAPVFPATTIQLPKPTPGFWTKKTDEKKDGEEKSAAPLFTFGKKAEDKKDTDAEKPAAAAPMFAFGKKSSDEDGKEKKDDKPASSVTPMFAFGKKPETEDGKNEKAAAPAPFTFGKKPDADKKNDDPAKPALSFPFPSFGSKPADSDATKTTAAPTLTFGTSAPSATTSFPSFGGAGGKSAPFSFGNLPTTTGPTANGDGNKEDDAEYVPPKAEVVENEEPNATYSTKCSVFKLVEKEYTKLGVGMLHLKDIEGKKSVLIRAATTTGTVWLNSTINSSMKVTKADEKGEKMRLLCPISSSEMGTFLIRFVNAATMKKVMDHVEENNK